METKENIEIRAREDSKIYIRSSKTRVIDGNEWMEADESFASSLISRGYKLDITVQQGRLLHISDYITYCIYNNKVQYKQSNYTRSYIAIYRIPSNGMHIGFSGKAKIQTMASILQYYNILEQLYGDNITVIDIGKYHGKMYMAYESKISTTLSILTREEDGKMPSTFTDILNMIQSGIKKGETIISVQEKVVGGKTTTQICYIKNDINKVNDAIKNVNEYKERLRETYE